MIRQWQFGSAASGNANAPCGTANATRRIGSSTGGIVGLLSGYCVSLLCIAKSGRGCRLSRDGIAEAEGGCGILAFSSPQLSLE